MKIMNVNIRINKIDDSNDFFYTHIESDILEWNRPSMLNGFLTIGRGNPRAKDPAHDGIKREFLSIFAKRTKRYHRYRIPKSFSTSFKIKDLAIFIQKKNGRHAVNGVYVSLDNMCDVLARVLYRSCFTDDVATLNKVLWKFLQIPENVAYAMENRVPYFFYSEYQRHDVRLNVQRIDHSTVAIEISDGIWGEMSFKELDKYCNFYVHSKKRGSWPFTSPKNLFTKLVGREPSGAELNLMIAFLQQNRKQDIVEKKAYQLISEMVEQRPERLFPVWTEDNKLSRLFVRGNHYDWLLSSKRLKASGTQDVQTFVYQPQEGKDAWKGPICIDNANNDSSIGDQFAARAMALLNDNMTLTMVSTINSYIRSEPNINRADMNEEMRRMRLK